MTQIFMLFVLICAFVMGLRKQWDEALKFALFVHVINIAGALING